MTIVVTRAQSFSSSPSCLAIVQRRLVISSSVFVGMNFLESLIEACAVHVPMAIQALVQREKTRGGQAAGVGEEEEEEEVPGYLLDFSVLYYFLLVLLLAVVVLSETSQCHAQREGEKKS